MTSLNTPLSYIFQILVLASLLTGCSASNKAVDCNFQESKEKFHVKGRQDFKVSRKISFGYYRTGGVTTSPSEGRLANSVTDLLWTSHSNEKQTIQFGFYDVNGLSSKVYCITHLGPGDFVREKTLSNGNPGISTALNGYSGDVLAVRILNQKENAIWQMIVDRNVRPGETISAGYLAKDKDNYYEIFPVLASGTKANKSGPVGYEFKNRAGQSVAMVSTNNNGVVTLGAVGTKEKFLLANASAALLLVHFMEE